MASPKISQPIWQAQISQNLKANPKTARLPRVALVGVGNEFNGDDAAGVVLARTLSTRSRASAKEEFLILEAGTAPENITLDLRRFNPEVVILIDAAQMDLAPGSIEWISWETTTGMSASSHMLPLSMLARYLTLEFGCSVYLLGIQPAHNESDTPLSPPVKAAVDEIVNVFSTVFLQTAPV